MITFNSELILSEGKALPSCDNRRGFYCWQNRITGKHYIGLSAGKRGIYRRVRDELNSGKSGPLKGTPALYSAFKKHGIEQFDCYFLMEFEGEPNEWSLIEQSLITIFQSKIDGYNITEGGSGTLGTSISLKQRKARSLEGKGGRKPRKIYTFLDPEENKIRIQNLNEFCKIEGLNSSHMLNVFNKKRGYVSHKGYRAIESIDRRKTYGKPFKVRDPEGNIHEGNNRKAFALKHGLNQAQFNHLINRKKHYNSHKGWVAVE